MFVKLLTAATGTNSPPTVVTDGVPKKGRTPGTTDSGLGESDSAVILVRSTAGSGTMTVTLRLWGWSDLTGVWHPIGTSTTDASRGLLNQATAIGEGPGPADTLRHAELVQGLSAFQRLYCEVTAIGGTSTAVSVLAVCQSGV